MAEHDLADVLRSMEFVCSKSPEPTALLDARGAILWTNASMRRAYGIDTSVRERVRLCDTVVAQDPRTHDRVTLVSQTRDPEHVECLTRHVQGHTMRVVCERRWLDAEQNFLVVTLRDVTWRHCQMGLHVARAAVLDTNHDSVEDALQRLVDTLYGYTCGMAPCVTLFDQASNTLNCAASRGLPKGYVELLVDVPVNANVGSCSHAVATNERTITENLLTDPKWASFSDLARLSEMRSCWSEPIRSKDGEMLGSFALYYGEPRAATEHGLLFFSEAAALVRETIERVGRLSEVRRLQRLHSREATLRKLIVDHVPSMIYWQGADRTIQGCNVAFANAIGYSDPDELIGTRAPAPQGWAVVEHIAPLDEELMLSGDVDTHVQEFVLRGARGRERTVVVENMCIRDEHGEIIGLLGVCDDVTDERRATAHAMQQQKLEALGRLVGGVAHDFNNLLFVIQSNLELIEDTLSSDDEFARTCAREALVASERGAKLTRQLLSSSRRATLTPTVIDLNETLTRVHSMLTRTLPATLDVHVEHAPYACTTRIDQSLAENALLNLALNARDAMNDRGNLTLSVDEIHLAHELGLDLPAGLYARVRVRDEGEGMPPDVLAAAFDPFFTTKPVDKGTGMGLAMVHGFVHQSGGAITLESELGKGTTATLYFPSHVGGLEHDSNVEADRDTHHPLHILLVEDDPHVRSALSNLLESMAHRVLAVEHAQAALDVLDAPPTPPIDLVLSDAVMPGAIQGIELAEHVKALHPDVPIILMSGYPTLPNSDPQTSASHITLTKPFTRSELTNALYGFVHAAHF